MSDLIFEVTLKVDAALVEKFEAYMTTRHIPEVIATGCFSNAWFGREELEYRVSYKTTQEEFDRYLADHASALRQDLAKHFPRGIQITRRNWDVIGSFIL